MTAPVIPPTPAPVLDWLRTLAPDAECGRRGESDDCALARWLTQRGARHAIVGDDAYCLDYTREKPKYHDTPLWAHDFVLQSDTETPELWGRPLTAAEAIAILETLEGEKE
jgi:hypothetical protein